MIGGIRLDARRLATFCRDRGCDYRTMSALLDLSRRTGSAQCRVSQRLQPPMWNSEP
jgi:hypothetical protein